MAVEATIKASEQQMEKALEHLRQELRSVRTGRASPGLVDTLKVEVESYGSTMTVKELGTVAVAEGNVLVIKPFDPGTLKDLQRGLEKSDLGINPNNDGKVIRLPVPPLSTERRKQIVGQIEKQAEAQKVSIRNVRRDAIKVMETAKKAKTLTEDDAKRGEERVQKLTDQYIKKVEEAVEQKTKELMEV